MKWLTKKLKNLFNLQDFDEIIILNDVIHNIMEVARETYPKEFIMLLKGGVKDGQLRVESLIYQTYQASRHATSVRINLPPMSGVVGSVHSHPGPSNTPSTADLRFFNKQGAVHLIIRQPYNKEDVQAFNPFGEKIPVRII